MSDFASILPVEAPASAREGRRPASIDDRRAFADALDRARADETRRAEETRRPREPRPSAEPQEKLASDAAEPVEAPESGNTTESEARATEADAATEPSEASAEPLTPAKPVVQGLQSLLVASQEDPAASSLLVTALPTAPALLAPQQPQSLTLTLPTNAAPAGGANPGAVPAASSGQTVPGAQGVSPQTGQTAGNASAFAEAISAAVSDQGIADAASADALTLPGQDARPTSAAATTASLPSARPAVEAGQAAGPATLQVQARFIERFDGRAQRFEVRLDPVELGRIDVRIEIGSDNRVQAVLAAHDGAALADLMKGSRALEQALNDAGVDLAEGGLSFELASDNGETPQGQSAPAQELQQRAAISSASLLEIALENDPSLAAYAARSYALGHIDIFA